MVTREELYHVQMDVKHVQAVQVNHADRILRLEKRQADDAALKSVWGTASPFPSVLGGTPQHGKHGLHMRRITRLTSPTTGPIPNANADVFDDFDDEQSQNLLGSLHLEPDEEPVRRGASRANSVRFDVSALQGSHWTASSRNSTDFGPLRPSSGFGSHPMTERSLSHRSDGRHSSAHSVHSAPSGRASSLGLDTNFTIGDQDDDSPLDTPDPPPGLFILGPVPSIIRCWLTSNFSHSSLIYVDVCTGSQRSLLDFSLAKQLGLVDQIHKTSGGRQMLRLPVYLPEAVITQPSSRSNSPAPQLPTLTVDFEITGLNNQRNKNGIRVFLGSDALRAHNADILFSQNVMTLYGDDRNKLSVPFVRPEDDNLFKNLCTGNIPAEKMELKATAQPFMPTDLRSKTPEIATSTAALLNGTEKSVKIMSPPEEQSASNTVQQSNYDTSAEENTRARSSSIKTTNNSHLGAPAELDNQLAQSRSNSEQVLGDTNRQPSRGTSWGSWRNGSANNPESESTSGYQRAVRGGSRSMKVLKPGSTIRNVSTTSIQSGTSYDAQSSSKASGETRRKSHAENVPLRWDSQRRVSDDQKLSKTVATVPRSSNPIGGASAFSWMNSGRPKTSSTATE